MVRGKRCRRRRTVNLARLITAIAPTLFAIGFFLVLGSVGAMEMNSLGGRRFWTQCIIGLLLMCSLAYEGK